MSLIDECILEIPKNFPIIRAPIKFKFGYFSESKQKTNYKSVEYTYIFYFRDRKIK